MKKFLAILVLGLLLIPNYSEAKTKDIGQGLTINIPNNFEYFEITLGEIYSEFPEIDNGDDTLKSLGIGDKTKFVVIAKSKKTIKFFKEISKSEGFEKLKEEYWEPLMEFMQGEEFLKLLEKEFKKMGKDPNKMSQKKIEATIMKISQKPSFQKKIEKMMDDHPAMGKFEKEYPFDSITILLIGDKKIESDITKTLEIKSSSEIKKDIKDFIKSMAKEDPSFKPLKKWKFEVKKNHNGKLYLYSDDPIDDPYTKKKADYSEVFLSTNNEKIFLGYSICSENCKKTNLLEIIRPTNLLAKSSETTEIKETKQQVAKKEILSWKCTGNNKNVKDISWQLDLEKKELTSQWFNPQNDKYDDQLARVISVGDNYVNVQDWWKDQSKWNPTSWEFNYASNIYTVWKGERDYYGNCKNTSVTVKKPKKEVKQTDDSNDITQQLIDLNELYKSGTLTKEEFEKVKKRLLN